MIAVGSADRRWLRAPTDRHFAVRCLFEALALAAWEVLEDQEQRQFRRELARPTPLGGHTIVCFPAALPPDPDPFPVLHRETTPESPAPPLPNQEVPMAKTFDPQGRREAVITALADGPRRTGDIADETGMNGYTSQVLRQMCDENLIVRHARGIYKLPDQGAETAAPSPQRQKPASPPSWQQQIEFLADWEGKKPDAFVADLLAAYKGRR